MMHKRLARHCAAVAAGLLLALVPAANWAADAAPPTPAQRMALLAAQVTAAEDLRAIKHLQRTYGYYLDKGMWTDLAEFFTDDAVANYPAGVFVGKQNIREHLYLNVGNVKMGEVGLGDKRLYNHMNIQPVVHLDPGGQTAKGRWRAFAFFGSYGGPPGTWAEGVYEMQYAKHNGVWKIAKLDYHSGFGASYATGWGYLAPPAPPLAGAGGPAPVPPPPVRRALAHPADIERNMACEGFPAACLAPFHYANPSTPAGGLAWDAASLPRVPLKADPKRVLAELVRRTDRLQAETEIENLQRIYGYYLDRAQWDQLADLFAEDGSIELAQQGVYVGKARVRAFLGSLGHHGLEPGWLNDHIQLQEVVDVSADGQTARARSRELDLTARYGKSGQWSEGIYENAYVRDHGVWKFQSVHWYPTFITDYDKGWTQDAQPAPGINPALPPDRPPSQVYEIFPKAHVPPYHYRNPVTGAAPTYPLVGGPDARLAAASLFDAGRATAPVPVRDVPAVLAETERRIERFKDYHELENLESAYGYYLDKDLWTDLADLFAKDGSIELAQRGVYRGERVRAFLKAVFGRGEEGPVAGRLGNHIQMQPVIHVDADGRRAHIRVRMLQQMGMAGRSSIGGAVYENEAVKEGGVWKFSVDHTYNTFSASYLGGPAKGAGRFMPGPTPGFAWDAPPTTVTAMFPIVYEIPYHYANPVTGRTELPPLPSIPAQLALYPIAPPAPSARLPKPVGMPEAIASALREIGPKIEAAKTTALYAPLFPREPYPGVKLLRDQAYGPHERHRLDVFQPVEAGKGRAIVVFIHGGGFSRGAKSSPGSPFYDNVGLWAAAQGLVGVTINYRYAPQFPYPAGVEDLTRVVAYLKAHAAEYGGDPNRIFLWGHSAGGAHAADYIVRSAHPGIAGAILTSGIYTLGDKVTVWKDYYGEDVARYRERESLPLLARSPVPLMVTYAELDPEAFQADAEALIRARSQDGLPLRQLRLVNHSHISETYAVGSDDESLSAPVLQFIRSTASAR